MVEDKVFVLLAPVVASLDVELLEVRWENGALQVIVDREGGVPLDTLASVSRVVSPILDQQEVIGGRYTLEVTSPGLERPLRTLGHFGQVVGEQVVVKLSPHNVPLRFVGKLLEVSDADITIEAVEIDGNPIPEPEEHVLEFSDITKASTVFDWRKALGGGAPRNKQSKRKGRR